jgi:hypothetical protein
MAQEPAPEAPKAWGGMCFRGGFFGRGFFGGGSWDTYDTIAEALGLTPTELFTELHLGKSLSEIAEEQGVEMDSIYDALNAGRSEAMRERIQQMVEDGTISQEQADWLLQGLEKGFMPMRRGGFRGFRGWSHRVPAEPTSTELSSS